MSKARLEALGEGRFRVSGVLDATTVGDLLEQSASFADSKQVEVDLSDVAEGDSAGLALLIEWLRAAKQRDQVIRFDHIPAQVSALARISEVEDLFSENETGRKKTAVGGQ